jgi:glycosyltransferase involved in cell wall biosynthesis
MDHSPLVSIIIPTFNRAEVLSKAIESVLHQTYTNTEIIIVDDGSTDNTQQILNRFNNRILVFSQENKGASAARNRGIQQSRGDIIAFLDSDDLWSPIKLERQVKLLTTIDASVPCCLCNINLVFVNGRQDSSFNLSWLHTHLEQGLWKNPLDVLATRFVLFNQAIAIRREALTQIGQFDECFRYMEDHDLALRLALLGPWAFIKEPLVTWYEGSSGSLTTQAKNKQLETAKTIYEMYKKIVNLSKNTQKVTKISSVRLKFELKRVFIKYKAIQLINSPVYWKKILGLFIKKLERYIEMIHAYSPWYPKMLVTSHKVDNLD